MPVAKMERQDDLEIFDDIRRMIIKALKKPDKRRIIAKIYNEYRKKIEALNNLFLNNEIDEKNFVTERKTLVVQQKETIALNLRWIFGHDKTDYKVECMFLTVEEELKRRGLIDCTRPMQYFPIPEKDLPLFLDFVDKLQKKYPKAKRYESDRQITFFVGIQVMFSSDAFSSPQNVKLLDNILYEV